MSLRGLSPCHVITLVGNTAPFKEIPERWQTVGYTVSDLAGSRHKLQIYRSNGNRVTARQTL